MSTQPADSVRIASSNRLNRQVGQYSLAATMAGVRMLALAAPAAGEVVVTRKTIPIPVVPFTTPESVKISMANNGVDNFSLLLSSFPSDFSSRQLLVAGVGARQPGLHNQILVGGSFYGKALALPRGANVGPSAINPSAAFSSYFFALVERTNASIASRSSRGYWGGNPRNRYLGVRFLIKGKFHYGWIRLTVTSNIKQNKPTLAATITGYAYETVPDKPILAGTTAIASADRVAEKPTAEVRASENIQNQSGPSLGMLAAGADALPIWRRE